MNTKYLKNKTLENNMVNANNKNICKCSIWILITYARKLQFCFGGVRQREIFPEILLIKHRKRVLKLAKFIRKPVNKFKIFREKR